MKKLTLIIITILISIFSISITSLSAGSIKQSNKAFEYNYTNNAWGHKNSGWYIQVDGNIVIYNEVNGKIESKNIGSIDSKLIKKKQDDLKRIKNDLSKKVQVGADMGQMTYKGFIYDKSNKSQEIILQIKGDFEQYNESKIAKELVTWLESLDINKN